MYVYFFPPLLSSALLLWCGFTCSHALACFIIFSLRHSVTIQCMKKRKRKWDESERRAKARQKLAKMNAQCDCKKQSRTAVETDIIGLEIIITIFKRCWCVCVCTNLVWMLCGNLVCKFILCTLVQFIAHCEIESARFFLWFVHTEHTAEWLWKWPKHSILCILFLCIWHEMSTLSTQYRWDST